MKITLSVLKADIGSIGGHITPSQALLNEVTNFVQENGKNLLIDFRISHTGDDIAILCTHEKGVSDEKIHKMAWDAFIAGLQSALLSWVLRSHVLCRTHFKP
jgi:fructose 1,6-bisphosphate aldolase/phosphatase